MKPIKRKQSTSTVKTTSSTLISVCETCKPSRSQRVNETDGGKVLYNKLTEQLKPHGPLFCIRKSSCMLNCLSGCVISVSSSSKWTYLVGHLHAGLVYDLELYLVKYALSNDGTIYSKDRAPTLANSMLGRCPSFLPEDLHDAAVC